MKKLAYLLFSLLLLACNQDKVPLQEEITATASPTLGAVSTGPLQTRKIAHNIACTGIVEVPPTDLISVHSRLSGQVSGLRHLPGDFVRKGTLLLRVTNPELIHQQRLLLEAKAQLAGAKKELDRQQTLAKGQATTSAALDAAQTAANLLEATYTGLQQELRQYGIDIDRLEEKVEFQSSVGVYAAGSGYVHEVMTNLGQMIEPTSELLRIAGTDHLHLELKVPASEAASVRKGQSVQYQLPFNEVAGIATVEKINPLVDAASATLNVHCHFEGDLPQGLVPGMFLNATLITGEQRIVGLPLSGTIKEGEEYFGYRKVGENLEKTLLREARVMDDFVTFRTEDKTGEWVTAGAYYMEGSE